MINDLYMIFPDEKTYDMTALEQRSRLQILLGQIKMILYTTRGSVIGSPSFGCNLEDYIYSFGLSNEEIQSKIIESIYSNCPDASEYGVTVEVSFFNGSSRDICLIDIIINNQKLLGVAVK